MINNLEKFYNSSKVFNFLETILKYCSILAMRQNSVKLKEQDLKY